MGGQEEGRRGGRAKGKGGRGERKGEEEAKEKSGKGQGEERERGTRRREGGKGGARKSTLYMQLPIDRFSGFYVNDDNHTTITTIRKHTFSKSPEIRVWSELEGDIWTK